MTELKAEQSQGVAPSLAFAYFEGSSDSPAVGSLQDSILHYLSIAAWTGVYSSTLTQNPVVLNRVYH